MQIAAETATRQSLQSLHGDTFFEVSATARRSRPHQYRAIRRNGAVPGQDPISMILPEATPGRLQFDVDPAVIVSPDDVREFRAFGGRRGAELLCRMAVDTTAAAVSWNNGIRANPDLLCQDLPPGRLERNSVRQGLPRRLDSLCSFGQVYLLFF